MCWTVIQAPHRGLVFMGGKPLRVLEAGIHVVWPFQRVRTIDCSLRTLEVDVDLITRGGTPTTVQVGYTARVTDLDRALVNMADPFATLRATVISVVSGTANSYTIDELAQSKNEIAEKAEAELATASDRHGWGLGDFQIAVGDPSMSEELKRLLMREEAVRRESAANLEKARNQLEVARELARVSDALDEAPFARELLRMQMLADMGEGGKIIVVDSQAGTAPEAALAEARTAARG